MGVAATPSRFHKLDIERHADDAGRIMATRLAPTRRLAIAAARSPPSRRGGDRGGEAPQAGAGMMPCLLPVGTEPCAPEPCLSLLADDGGSTSNAARKHPGRIRHDRRPAAAHIRGTSWPVRRARSPVQDVPRQSSEHGTGTARSTIGECRSITPRVFFGPAVTCATGPSDNLAIRRDRQARPGRRSRRRVGRISRQRQHRRHLAAWRAIAGRPMGTTAWCATLAG